MLPLCASAYVGRLETYISTVKALAKEKNIALDLTNVTLKLDEYNESALKLDEYAKQLSSSNFDSPQTIAVNSQLSTIDRAFLSSKKLAGRSEYWYKHVV